MPSVIATMTVNEDRIEDAVQLFKELAADTLAKEPGTLAYVPHQDRDQPTKFVFYEKYESDEAFAEHGKNLAAVGKKFAGILAGAPEIVRLEEV